MADRRPIEIEIATAPKTRAERIKALRRMALGTLADRYEHVAKVSTTSALVCMAEWRLADAAKMAAQAVSCWKMAQCARRWLDNQH